MTYQIEIPFVDLLVVTLSKDKFWYEPYLISIQYNICELFE